MCDNFVISFFHFFVLIAVYRPFPRGNLLYVKEIGLGWFGQVNNLLKLRTNSVQIFA